VPLGAIHIETLITIVRSKATTLHTQNHVSYQLTHSKIFFSVNITVYIIKGYVFKRKMGSRHHHLALQLLWVFVFSANSLQVLLSLAVSFQFLTFIFFRSSVTSSCHRCLGLPTGLVPIGFQSNSFLVYLAWSILGICPSYLILYALMNLTIPETCINLSISMLFRILIYIVNINRTKYLP